MALSFTIRLADLVIGLTTLHDETRRLCRDYLLTGQFQPDIVVASCQAAIDFERRQDKLGDFDDAYYETLAVYRAIAEELPRFGRVLVHGSAVAIAGSACLFMAPSGTGKSTHTRWWRTEFASEHPLMVNDDKPIIGIGEDGVVVWGTPWDGKEHLSSNVRVSLAGIGLLERGEEDLAVPLAGREAFVDLMRHAYRPVGAQAARTTMELLTRLGEGVPLFRVRVTNSAQAARVTRRAMLGE